jgi:capsular polysaccharide biosynthesis protein
MEIKEYAKLIKKRLWLIILCVLVSTLTSAFYSYQNYQPIYVASNKLIINKTIGQDNVGIEQQMDFNAISVNIGLIDTYKEIIKTPAIMDKVVQRYPELNLSTDHLISTVYVSALNKTQVMTIGTTDYSYERAANIVNAVAEVVKTEIPRIMKVNNVEILNIADPNEQPAPENSKINQSIIISFIASLILAMGITFLLEFLNDTLKTKKDIQTVMGLPLLSAVPIIKQKKVKQQKKNKLRKQVGEGQYATIKQ